MRSLNLFFALVLGCGSAAIVREANVHEETPMPVGDFGSDVAFMREHLPDLIVLSNGDARIAIAPEYQGRVMTSSARGDRGTSFGWINRALIGSGERRPHMNAFGGEDRFWLGPEGGQYSLYFPSGAPFDLEHWQVPAAIDWGAWEVADRSASEVTFIRAMNLTNRAGTTFHIGVERRVRLRNEIEINGASAVAYESINIIRNEGDVPWRPETGLISVWILSMYQPSPSTTVVIPYDGEDPAVNTAYFGEVPADRMRIDRDAHAIYFRADGSRRSKIGVPIECARDVLGSWDAQNSTLTIVTYSLPDHAESGYVNSMWQEQSEPFHGDVVNSYNDGPPEPGAAPLGPFYELESSSPAAALDPGQRLEHRHSTVHYQGSRAALDTIARERLGVSLDAIEHALPQ